MNAYIVIVDMEFGAEVAVEIVAADALSAGFAAVDFAETIDPVAGVISVTEIN